eukprot:SAG31_NODE_5375_length_2577_cov_1.209040_1_plen_251_part_00
MLIHQSVPWLIFAASGASEPTGGYVRAWAEGLANASVAGGSRTCEAYTEGIRRFRASIDEISIIGMNIANVILPDGSLSLAKKPTPAALDTLDCIMKAKAELHIKNSPCLGFAPEHLKAIAAHPEAFASHALNFTRTYDLDGFNFDEEIRLPETGMNATELANLEKGWDLLAEGLHLQNNGSLTEYKGCVRNHLPYYLGQNCSAAVRQMPHLDRVVAAGTYWNNSVDGFEGEIHMARFVLSSRTFDHSQS